MDPHYQLQQQASGLSPDPGKRSATAEIVHVLMCDLALPLMSCPGIPVGNHI